MAGLDSSAARMVPSRSCPRPGTVSLLMAVAVAGTQHARSPSMNLQPPPPFDAWSWMQAFQQTWLASLDPAGVGRQFRDQRLARLIRSTQQASPLYARRAPGARELADFGPIGKAELMHHFDHWATDRRITRQAVEALLHGNADVASAWLGSYLVWTSSGTSGEPGIFVQDTGALAAFDAIDALRLRSDTAAQPTLGLWGMGRRFAYVGAIGGAYAGNVSLQRLQRLVPAPWAPQIAFISVLEPLTTVAQRLQALRPQVLITYPSCAVALAGLQDQGELDLQLDEAWLGGEQLTAPQRDQVARSFGCPVRNSYGASEFYSIAFECSHGQLHLNDDWVVLEGVDTQGRATPPGEFSELTLLTNLANHVQPLLRYELTDRVRFVPGPCGCGGRFPVIEVQGRSDDGLALPVLHGGTVTLLPLALETVVEEGAGVAQFQLLLREDQALELRLPLQGSEARAAFDRCRRALRAWLQAQGARPLRLVLGAEAPLQQPGSGKLRRVVDLTRASHAVHTGVPAGKTPPHDPD